MICRLFLNFFPRQKSAQKKAPQNEALSVFDVIFDVLITLPLAHSRVVGVAQGEGLFSQSLLALHVVDDSRPD